MGVEEASNGFREGLAGAVEIVRRSDAPLPLFATLDGAPVVILAAEEYRRLLAASLQSPVAEVRAAARRPAYPAPLPSTVERDPEVAAFLRSCFTRAVTIAATQAACRERFGAARTPSASRIARFRSKVRHGA